MRHHMPFALLWAVVMACSEAPTEPAVATTNVPTLSTQEFSPTRVWLRSESEALDVWGVLHVMVGSLAPPNPCGVWQEGATLVVCGVIHNPEGVLLTGGTLRLLGELRDLELDFALPPNPCLTYHIRATASPDLGDRGLELPAVQPEFTTVEGRIAGSAVPHAPSIGPEGLDRDASFDAPPNPCLVEFAPDLRVR
jgi:hypothetical protein